MINETASRSITNEQEHIRKSNRVYEDPSTVESYLFRPLHVLRISLAVNLLNKEMKSEFKSLFPTKLRILELASSTGIVANQLASHGSKVIASDIEWLPLKKARTCGLNCVELDASGKLPFPTGTFHGLLMGELIEHIFDTSALLAECYRVLAPKGILVLTTPNLASLQDRLRFLIGRSPRHVNPLHEYLYLHIRPFTLSLLIDILEKSGFTVRQRSSTAVRFILSSGQEIHFRWFARLFPGLGDSLIVSAEKRDIK